MRTGIRLLWALALLAGAYDDTYRVQDPLNAWRREAWNIAVLHCLAGWQCVRDDGAVASDAAELDARHVTPEMRERSVRMLKALAAQGRGVKPLPEGGDKDLLVKTLDEIGARRLVEDGRIQELAAGHVSLINRYWPIAMRQGAGDSKDKPPAGTTNPVSPLGHEALPRGRALDASSDGGGNGEGSPAGAVPKDEVAPNRQPPGAGSPFTAANYPLDTPGTGIEGDKNALPGVYNVPAGAGESVFSSDPGRGRTYGALKGEFFGPRRDDPAEGPSATGNDESRRVRRPQGEPGSPAPEAGVRGGSRWKASAPPAPSRGSPSAGEQAPSGRGGYPGGPAGAGDGERGLPGPGPRPGRGGGGADAGVEDRPLVGSELAELSELQALLRQAAESGELDVESLQDALADLAGAEGGSQDAAQARAELERLIGLAGAPLSPEDEARLTALARRFGLSSRQAARLVQAVRNAKPPSWRRGSRPLSLWERFVRWLKRLHRRAAAHWRGG